MPLLSFDDIEECLPENVQGTTEDGHLIVSAQWLHDFAKRVAAKEALACAATNGQQAAGCVDTLEGRLMRTAYAYAKVELKIRAQRYRAATEKAAGQLAG